MVRDQFGATRQRSPGGSGGLSARTGGKQPHGWAAAVSTDASSARRSRALRQSLAALAILLKNKEQPKCLSSAPFLDARRSRSTLLPDLALPLSSALAHRADANAPDRRASPERFAAYIAARRFDAPRPLLIRAAGLAEPEDHGPDAGAGALNATMYLLSAGFKRVTALDSSPASQRVAAELPRQQVRFVLSRFEDFEYPDRAYEFVNAEFSLPFISAAAFPSVFTKLMASREDEHWHIFHMIARRVV
jgi:Methyltransferase domain